MKGHSTCQEKFRAAGYWFYNVKLGYMPHNAHLVEQKSKGSKEESFDHVSLSEVICTFSDFSPGWI